MKKIIFSSVIVFMLVMVALLAANLPPIEAETETLRLECLIVPDPTNAGQVTNFYAAASGGVPPYSWLWTVNGEEVSTDQNTAYTFPAGGIYDVCINVTDSLDNKRQCCTPVTVTGDLNLTCDVSPNPTKVGHVTDFTAEVSGGIPPYSWLWTVNGEEVPGGQNTTHTFAAAGDYNVCVNVSDSSEPENEQQCCTPVTVNPALRLECEVSPEPTEVGQVTNFFAAASGGVPPYEWSWMIDGEEVSTDQNITHTFAAGGTYNVCVNVTDSLDNKDHCCTPVTVNEELYRLELLPEYDSNLVNTTHSLTATVYQGDNVMPDVNVTWSITGEGSFSGTPESTTDVNGQADAVITSSETGQSTVRCEVTGNLSVFDTATKVWTTPPPPSPGGGGGGGCPLTKYLTVDWDGKITKKPLRTNDRLAVDLLGTSPDGRHSLLLERGTLAPIVDGETHYLIVIREFEETLPLPKNTVAIVTVEATPDGAAFDRDIFLTLGFNELPENALNATMAYYDDVNGTWVPLESEAGGPSGVAKLTLSAPIKHFTIFGVLVELAPTPPPPPPAHFVASGDLNIVPSVEKTTFVTRTGESVTITANMLNDGGQEDTYTVELKLNGETVDTKTVTLGAGQSQPVSFTVSGLDYGQHEVEVDGLSGEFTTSRTITWWLIIVIIVVIGLIIWGIVWRRRRRRAQQEA